MSSERERETKRPSAGNQTDSASLGGVEGMWRVWLCGPQLQAFDPEHPLEYLNPFAGIHAALTPANTTVCMHHMEWLKSLHPSNKPITSGLSINLDLVLKPHDFEKALWIHSHLFGVILARVAQVPIRLANGVNDGFTGRAGIYS